MTLVAKAILIAVGHSKECSWCRIVMVQRVVCQRVIRPFYCAIGNYARMFELYYRAAALLRLDWILSLANDGGAASLPLHTPRSAHCCAIYSRSIAVVAEQKLHKYL